MRRRRDSPASDDSIPNNQTVGAGVAQNEIDAGAMRDDILPDWCSVCTKWAGTAFEQGSIVGEVPIEGMLGYS